jgi:glycosyltransferase involved in cell wall biosynthesis
MRLLLLTNLYPPQELGGYGRCMADFAWALQQRGHQLTVLSSDAPYLGPGGGHGPSGEPVQRSLRLKGTYNGGVQALRDPLQCEQINRANQRAIETLWRQRGPFDGALVGNIDLLGVEVLQALLGLGATVLHHIGFVTPPFPPQQLPRSPRYRLVGASQAVATALQQAGLGAGPLPVVFPGVRSDLFGLAPTGRPLPSPLDGLAGADAAGPPPQLGTPRHPLRVCFAGLLMGSKGAHTLVEALALMTRQGFTVEGYLAGGSFQAGYREQLEGLLLQHGVAGVTFLGQLQRRQLARCLRLHHVCVFPSIHPEAFGIVGAEAMASGLALVSSAVGGAAELFEDGVSGLRFKAGDAADLAHNLIWLCQHPVDLQRLASAGAERARQALDVGHSAAQLEALFNAGPPPEGARG